MTAQPTEPTVFHTVLARLAANGINCETGDGKLQDQDYGSYHFADGSHLTWGAQSNTGAENSNTHPISAHGQLGGFFIDDTDGTDGTKETEGAEEHREFTTGDFDTDADGLVAWITSLADTHGRAQQ